MMPSMTRNEQLAWAAGFFDGEGCSTMRTKPSGYASPRLTVKQKQRGLLVKFQSYVGGCGSIYLDRSSGVSAWICGAKDAEAVMKLLWPWLSKPKRQQWREVKSRANMAKPITHCKRGHEFTPENTYVYEKTGNRACRICIAMHARNYYLTNKRKSGKMKV